MATIKPFAALRPDPARADRICELPYDVMSTEEAREIASGNPLSFLHVSKPEIDLAPGTDPHSEAVYKQGRINFQKLVSTGALRQDDRECFYLYRQHVGSHTQTGLVAVVSCAEYRDGIIRKHEFTRPDKEDDRVRHIEALNSQTGPAFLIYPKQKAIDDLVTGILTEPPAVDFTAADGVRHSAWVIAEADRIQFLEGAFRRMPNLYIADGHHRSAAAARVSQDRQGTGHSAYYLNVIFPHDQVRILPYNRVLSDLNGLSPASLIERLGRVFHILPEGNATPASKHEIALYLGGRWVTLQFLRQFTEIADPIERLDVTLLQTHILAPIFGIDNPRTSKRINFVGGIRGIPELERLVNSGDYACAFSMFPTGVEELMQIADAGGIMPPKSTWFEPKLRDGMFCHLL